MNSEQLTEKIEKHEAQYKQLEEDNRQTHRQQCEATEKIEKQLKEIEKPYITKKTQLNSEMRKTSEKLRELRNDRRIVTAEEILNVATELTEETGKAFLTKHGIFNRELKIQKKPTPNGLNVLAETDGYSYSRYWLFDGIKAVAVWYRAKPQGFSWGETEPSEAHLNGEWENSRRMKLADFKKQATSGKALTKEVYDTMKKRD